MKRGRTVSSTKIVVTVAVVVMIAVETVIAKAY